MSDEAAISERERQIVLWLNNVNHAMNHFQNQMVNVMYPTISRELGFGPVELGILTMARSVFTNWSQLGYGLLAALVQRFRLLGIGSLIYALGTFSSGLAWNYLSFMGIRCLAAVGSSAQHPIGASLLASYFRKSRGTVMALNTSVSQVGSMLAPLAAGALLLTVGWRQTFYLVAILGVIMALAYFFFQDRVRDTADPSESKRAKLGRSVASYLRVLRNRNVLLIALVMLVGGAGRGDITPTYVPLHLERDFSFATVFTVAAIFLYQLGGLCGPIAFGWISDRGSRRTVLQTSLVLSTLSTLWLAWQGANWMLLLVNVLVQGAVTTPRGTLTQAMVADSVSETDQDAAYSLYFFLAFFASPIWSLTAGFLMGAYNFSVAFSVLAMSDLAAMVLMSLVKDIRPAIGRRIGR